MFYFYLLFIPLLVTDTGLILLHGRVLRTLKYTKLQITYS